MKTLVTGTPANIPPSELSIEPRCGPVLYCPYRTVLYCNVPQPCIYLHDLQSVHKIVKHSDFNQIGVSDLFRDILMHSITN